MNKRILVLVVVLLTSAFLSGCTPGSGRYDASSPAGFLSGIWHGWIAPVSLVIGLFDNTTRIYEPNNTGWFYDLRFYIAIIGGFGGLSLTRHKLKRKVVPQVYVEH
jgi:hypothetical protein